MPDRLQEIKERIEQSKWLRDSDTFYNDLCWMVREHDRLTKENAELQEKLEGWVHSHTRG